MECLDDNTLAAMAEGLLADDEQRDVEAHLATCPPCTTLAAAFGRNVLASGSGSPFVGGDILPGDVLGRYEVVDWLGRGGMGQVYLANDPSLDREVALKLVSGANDPKLDERLAIEARAMARLSAANVVTVFDVGAAAGRTFIAMERIRGESLDRYLAKEPRSWREIVKLFVDAGRGLLAAHTAGVVHRDFKPSNVFVTDDGTVKVGDFGLARTEPAKTGEDGSVQVTAAAGTPAYMSPEQHCALPADELSDQFSFAVALWEALHGERPFRGDTAEEIRAATLRGELAAVQGSRVPRALGRILRRALSADPSDRFSSMADMLRELEAQIRPRFMAVTAALAATAAIALVLAFAALGSEEVPCPVPAARFDGVWDASVRVQVVDSLASAPRSYAAALAQSVAGSLDSYREDWTASHTKICRATRVSHEQSAGLMDARMRCLDQRLAELKELASLFSEDPELVDEALQASQALLPPAWCTSMEAGGSLPLATRTPADDAAADVLARGHAFLHAGKAKDAHATALRGLDLIDSGTSLLRGELELLAGLAALEIGLADEAEARLQVAAELAGEVGDDRGVATAWVHLVSAVGLQQRRHDAGLVWAEAAKRAVSQAMASDLESQLNASLARLKLAAGDVEEASEAARAAIESARLRAEDDPAGLAEALSSATTIWLATGSFALAEGANTEALAIFEQHLGPEHPRTAKQRAAQAQLAARQGDIAKGLEIAEGALQTMEAAQGEFAPGMSSVLTDLANMHVRTGNLEAAERMVERLRDVTANQDEPSGVASGTSGADEVMATIRHQQGRFEESATFSRRAIERNIERLGPDHFQVAGSQTMLGMALVSLGRSEDAIRELTSAVRIYEKAKGPESPAMTAALHHMALARYDQGDCDAASVILEREAAIIEKHQGANSFNLSFPLLVLGSCALDQARFADAAGYFTRVLEIREQSSRPGAGEARFFLAQARWGMGERSEARSLARQARDEVRKVPIPAFQQQAKEIDAWLRRH